MCEPYPIPTDPFTIWGASKSEVKIICERSCERVRRYIKVEGCSIPLHRPNVYIYIYNSGNGNVSVQVSKYVYPWTTWKSVADGSSGSKMMKGLASPFLTENFTAMEPQNPPFDVPELFKVCRSPDLEALEFWKFQSGTEDLTDLELRNPEICKPSVVQERRSANFKTLKL